MHRLSSRKNYILGYLFFQGRQSVEKRAFSMKKSLKSQNIQKFKGFDVGYMYQTGSALAHRY